MRLFHQLNHVVDASCSLLVSLAVAGVNVYFVDFSAHTVAVPVMTLGACGAAAVSKVLKRVIRQPRPRGAEKASPGMPSNHATALSCLTVLACAGVWRASTFGWPVEYAPYPWPVLYGCPAILLYGLYTTALRVVRGHHTLPQAVAGYGLGFSLGCLYTALNFWQYQGSERGGRVDELPQGVKVALLWVSVAIGVLALHSIVKGSPFLEARRTARAMTVPATGNVKPT